MSDTALVKAGAVEQWVVYTINFFCPTLEGDDQEGSFKGFWTGEIDYVGKLTFKNVQGGADYYLFPGEIVGLERAPERIVEVAAVVRPSEQQREEIEASRDQVLFGGAWVGHSTDAILVGQREQSLMKALDRLEEVRDDYALGKAKVGEVDVALKAVIRGWRELKEAQRAYQEHLEANEAARDAEPEG